MFPADTDLLTVTSANSRPLRRIRMVGRAKFGSRWPERQQGEFQSDHAMAGRTIGIPTRRCSRPIPRRLPCANDQRR